MTSRSCVLVGCAILTATACAVTVRPVQPPAHSATPLEGGGDSPPAAGFHERGMGVESAPLTTQIELRVRGSKDGSLSDGDMVVNGDRIQILAQTTEDAHLYLVYCTGNRELTVFPTYGSIPTLAGAITVAPGKEASLILDDHLGSEVLYVIISRTDLASADPRLAAALRSSQVDEPAAACGRRFQTVVTTSATAEPPATRVEPTPESTDSNTRMRPSRSDDGSLTTRSALTSGPHKPKQPTSRAIAGAKGSNSDAGAPVEPFQRGMVSAEDDERPLVTIERGMHASQNGLAEVTVNADANGIAVLRYRFNHVAAPRSLPVAQMPP